MPFNRPTLPELVARCEADLAARLGLGQLVPRGFLKAIARAMAGMFHGAYGFQDWASRQVLPDTGDVDTLERWANDLGVPRKPATFAEGPVELTGSNGVDVVAGTIVQRADGQRFEVLADGTIASGSVIVDVRAQTAGELANSAATTQLSLVSPITGVNSAVEVDTAGVVGGTDQETDAELLARVLQRMQNPPQGGATADYVRWALEVPGVTRAWCLREHFGIGTVGVTFAVDDDPAGPIPDAGKVAEVQAYIDDPTRKPVPAEVTVFAPIAQLIFVSISLDPDTLEVRDAVEHALIELIRREGAPGGTLLVSHVREAISNAPGEYDHVLNFPVGDTIIAAGKIPVLQDPITWT